MINCIDSIGLKGVGVDELSMESTPAGSRSIKDHKIIIGKLLLILRLLNSDLVKEESSRCILIPKAITWAVDVFLALLILRQQD